MAPGDISAILAAIAELSARVNNLALGLARIEERTSVLSDHETRLRDAEERSRIAGEVAAVAKSASEAHGVEIEMLKEQLASMGKFTIGMIAKFTVAALGATVTLLAIVRFVQENW